MDLTLVVVRPFGTHAVGDRITETATVAATLASDHAHSVVAVQPAIQAPPAAQGEH